MARSPGATVGAGQQRSERFGTAERNRTDRLAYQAAKLLQGKKDRGTRRDAGQ